MRASSVVSLFLATIEVTALDGISIALPGCAERCMVDSMYITQCQDIDCLCHEEHFQKSLFQCLYSQCDSSDYGPALLHSMKTCMTASAEIHVGFPTVTEQLDNREEEYLAGQELPEVPGLQLRQDSAGPYTYTVWATATVTTTTNGPLPVTIVTPFSTPIAGTGAQSSNLPGLGPVTSFFEANSTQATSTRPWMITASETGRHLPSYLGLIVWAQQFHSSAAATRTTRSPILRTCSRTNPPSSFTTRHQARPFSRTARRYDSGPRQPAEDPNFTSILDNPVRLVRTGRQHNKYGLAFLALIPVTAFLLGSWQVQRLGWKTELIARFEDRLVRTPLPLPPRVDPDAIHDFDFRRVVAKGRFRHDQEMLIGPRMRDGDDGYMVVTPLERDDGDAGPGRGSTTVLVNRGWISKKMKRQQDRGPGALPQGEVVVEGLLREPWKKNMFTPDNRPDKGEFYFPDVRQMAELTGSQAVWVESTMEPDWSQTLDMEAKGIPLGRAAEVNLRNNHAQYIFTWYGLAAATSIMFYMVVKKPPTDITRRVRMNKNW
ncbi:putative SURF1-like protein [Seiridium cardinale]|uniref:SURF1-like protein n=1 Tax=Seiridium cardinale TaxID=138064 RepID=A0ABR2XMY1_9PEZI